MKKVLTLAFPVKEEKILLGLKKRGFGEGLYNGFGGKVEEGEDIESAMRRELKEETGLVACVYQKLGILTFYYSDRAMVVHVFKVMEYEGAPVESEEMTALWFDSTAIPFSKMWPDDEYWFPYFIENKPFEGEFWFSDKTDESGRLQLLKANVRPLTRCYFA
jgi:ADP-ribose pyrophosphatase YjhB (NUDIX family)